MDKNVSELLKERNEKRTDDNAILDKALHYVPFTVFSFAEFEMADKLDDIRQEYNKAFQIFMQIADNIMYERPENHVDLMIKLLKDFSNKLIDIKLTEGQMLKSGTIALFKSNGQLQWIGVPTNKFKDRDNDILSDAAHKKFVKMLKDGNVEMPNLYPWHTGTIGKATWVDYDERGFLVAGGYILKEWENFAINLIMNTDEPMGMSHGMYSKDIKRDSDGVIIEYKSFEFSFLPLDKAANLLTSFTTI
jgi:hypothetical protein